MRRIQNITQMSTSHGIDYEEYLGFKSTLPDTLTASELLQIRWIMTHASYFVAGASISIICSNPGFSDLLKQAFHSLDNDITLDAGENEPCDMAIIFDALLNEDLTHVFNQLKANGLLVLRDDIEYSINKPDIEICGLKVYRKPILKEDVDLNIHIFIPVHNGISQTVRCLQSIYNQTLIDSIKITIIDDGSTDGTSQIIKERFPDVSMETGDGSLWWTGSINKGLQSKQHTFQQGDYFLLVNSDVVLNPGTVFSLLTEAVSDRSMCFAPLGFSEDESIACGEAEDGHIFYRFEPSSKMMMQNNNIYSVLSLFGRCTLYPVEVLDQVDSFDAINFPHYWGDTDFSLRAKEFGYKFRISGKTSIMVQHDEETTGSHHVFFAQRRSLKEVLAYLTDIKSLGNVKYLWRFYSRHYPKKKYNFLLKTIIKALMQTRYKV